MLTGSTADSELSRCRICPRECGTDRNVSAGYCGAGPDIEISSWNLHFGEEPSISGNRGSGTIFFTHCGLKCIFCQNYPISHYGHGRAVSEGRLARIMLELQEMGAHNINLITPTHYSLQIYRVLRKIKGRELTIPVVYNCGGYEKTETLRMLRGMVDIYMPDAKYSSRRAADMLCRAPDYWEVNKSALMEMYRQTGPYRADGHGMARSGVMVRHLVLPGDLSGSYRILDFIAGNMGRGVRLSLMSQYHPAYRTVGDSMLGSRVEQADYEKVVEYAIKIGLDRGYIQEF